MGLYGRDIKLKISMSYLTMEFKVSKARTAMTISVLDTALEID